jgi:hypothetical protein
MIYIHTHTHTHTRTHARARTHTHTHVHVHTHTQTHTHMYILPQESTFIDSPLSHRGIEQAVSVREALRAASTCTLSEKCSLQCIYTVHM